MVVVVVVVVVMVVVVHYLWTDIQHYENSQREFTPSGYTAKTESGNVSTFFKCNRCDFISDK